MRLPVLALSLFCLASPASAQSTAGQPFRIFFDWGKPELSRDAETILGEVASAYRRLGPSRVLVSAHSDRSGSDAVNLAASRRRAEAVKSYLIAHGIPAAAIRTAAFGESRPIVPTEDGVREAQNRRVEIAFEGMAAAAATTVSLIGPDGSRTGSAVVSGTSLTVEAGGLPRGEHGLHLHVVGRCDGPDFASAGPHWNPSGRKHGRDNPEGPHLGDLPNLTVGADGRGSATLEVPQGFVDADGAALVIHASPDDYRTDPSGNSGARIACAAFTR